MSKKSTKALASATIMSLVMTTSLAVPASAAVNQTLAGAGRYETASKIVDAGWTTATTAIIASGEDANRVDALTVAPLAKKLDAPVVLAKPGKALDADTLAKLTKLGVKTVYIANGTGVFTADVDAQLANAGLTVKRLGGVNRFETALNIAKEFGPTKNIVVASANDANLVDALSIASIAAIKGMPIFISSNDAFDANEAAYIKTLGVEKSYVVGGLVKDATLTAAGITGATRLSGAGRYESNYAVLNAFKDDADIKTAANVYVASGENANLIDALAGAPLAAKKGAPIVLAHDSILADTQTLLKSKINSNTDVEIFGGTGAVTPAVATAFNALVNGTTSDLKAGDITAVKAISNTKVEVTFKDGVTPTTDATAYKVVTKGTTTALAVSSAALEGSKVVLTTAAQTAGTAYTLTAGAATMNFAGIAADTTAPSVSSVKATDTNTVEVTFDRVVDSASALTAANYTLNNSATVKSASLDSTRKVVTLTTDGVTNNKLYTLTVNNVKNADGVAMKTASKVFAGKSDTTAPKINGNIVVSTPNRIVISFTDDHGVDQTSAETVANYAISDGTNALKVNSAKAVLNEDTGYYDQVILTTDTQTTSKKYTLTISNLTDGSISANKVSSPLTAIFYGKSKDAAAPVVNYSIQARTNTSVVVKFTDTSALDVASATNPDNYVFNNDLKVEKVEIKDSSDLYAADGKTVIITTSSQEAKGYTLTVKGVADEYGNAIQPMTGSQYRAYPFMGMDTDTKAPYVISTTSVDANTVKVKFDNYLDEKTATDPTNYVINGDLGAVLSAKYDDDSQTVTLKTPTQVTNKSYKITMNGIADLSGNAMSNVTASFVSLKTSADITAPTVLYAQALSKDEVRLYFDKAIKESSVTTSAIAVTGTSITLTKAGFADDDNTLIMKVSGTLSNGTEYAIQDAALTGITDMSNNHYTLPTDGIKFYGTTADNTRPTMVSWEQTDMDTIKVHFSEDVTTVSGTLPSGVSADQDGDDTTVIDLTTANPKGFDATTDLSVNFSSFVTDLLGAHAADAEDVYADANITTTIPSTDKSTVIRPYLTDEEQPVLLNVEPINKNKIKLTYSENLANAGAYRVYHLGTDGKTPVYETIATTSVYSTDHTIVYLTLSGTGLSSTNNYTLQTITGAVNLVGKIQDITTNTFDFAGTDITANNDYVTGVAIADATHIQVMRTSDYATTTTNGTISVKACDADGNATGTSLLLDNSNTTKSAVGTYDIELKAPLLAGTTYLVDMGSDGYYKFSGIVGDSNIITTTTAVTFSGESSDYVVNVLNASSFADVVTNAAVTTTGCALGTTLTSGDYIVEVVNTHTNTIVYAVKATIN